MYYSGVIPRYRFREEVRAGNRKEKEDDRHKAGEDSGDIV